MLVSGKYWYGEENWDSFFVTGKIVVANGIYQPKLAKLLDWNIYETFTGFIICDTMTNSKIRYVHNHSSEIRSLCSWKFSRKIIYHERILSFPEAQKLLFPYLGIFNDFKVLVIFFSSNLKMFLFKILNLSDETKFSSENQML